MSLKNKIIKLFAGIIILYIAFDIIIGLLDNVEVLILFFLLPSIFSFFLLNYKDILIFLKTKSKKIQYNSSKKNDDITGIHNSELLILKPLIRDIISLFFVFGELNDSIIADYYGKKYVARFNLLINEILSNREKIKTETI